MHDGAYHQDPGGNDRFRCTAGGEHDPPLSGFDKRVDAARLEDSKADCRRMVPPPRPAGTRSRDEDRPGALPGAGQFLGACLPVVAQAAAA